MGKTSSPHPTHLQRNEASQSRKLSGNSSTSMHMTRSHATSTTSNTATSSSVAPPTVHDHNYVGDPGPSTSSAANRNLRKMFPRHQRSFDESEGRLNAEECSTLSAETSRLRRGLPSSTTVGTASTYQRELTHAEPVRRGRSRYSQENSQTEPSADENVEDDDEENAEGVSDMGTGGSTESSTDDASDSEDNQPLTSYVPKIKHGRKPGRKRRVSDDSFVADEDEDDDFNNKRRNGGRKRENGVSRRINNRSTGQTNSRRNQRGSRNQKRPRYNELTDDDEYTATTAATNSRGRRTRNESISVVGSSAVPQDDHDASTMDSDDDQLVSVSSRGRVRKITAKARGIFKE